MKKSHKKRSRSGCFGIEATTTAKDWGFCPVPGKGGSTRNHEIQESMIQREMREMKKD